MVIINIKNGLGNQMFQYAFGKVLEWKYKMPVYFDFMREDISTPLKTDLFVFNIGHVREIEPKLVEPFKPFSISQFKHQRKYFSYMYYKLRRIFNPKKLIMESYPSIYVDCFDKLNKRKDYYFLGHWMNASYYEEYRSEIVSLFNPVDNSFYNLPIVKEITHSDYDSVSLHIRRGDYLTCGFMEPADLEYYHHAINLIKERVKNPFFYIFTDDPEWVRTSFDLLAPYTLVTGNNGTDSYKDILLMSLCKHNIIANSSFSWWGAWLNENASKIILAPKKWYASKDSDKYVHNMIPKGWITL